MNQAQSMDLLAWMWRSRASDETAHRLLRQSHIWFFVSSMGHESLAAVGMQLRKSDLIFMYYRDTPVVALAKGVPLHQIVRYALVKFGPDSPTRNMPGHLSNREWGVFSVATPTGAQCLPGVGAAWGLKMRGSDDIVVVGIGDAATRQGEFYEAVTFALVHQLPVLFVVSDNRYGISSKTDAENPLRLGIFPKERVTGVDGRHPNLVFEAVTPLIQSIRAGGGPRILWIEMDRLDSHTSSDDQRRYRPQAERDAMIDPIETFTTWVANQFNLSLDTLADLKADCINTVTTTYDAVLKETETPSAAIDGLFTRPTEVPPLPVTIESTDTMVIAIQKTFAAALETSPQVVMLGQDIEDPKGGVFGLTKGLSTQFPSRVHNAPLAEATIVGTGVGLAATGFRPVFELQFVDFVGPAMMQLLGQVASLHWRSLGDWQCPLVIYAPYGAYLPGGGIWHSEAYDSMLASIPGLQVAVPSNASDASEIFWQAIHNPNPTIILVPKHLIRAKQPALPQRSAEWGRAKVIQNGNDVTVVSWGNSVPLVAEVCETNKNWGIEHIDLRFLVPCEWSSIRQSVQKTGRLVVVHEDKALGSFGSTIIQQMVSDFGSFNSLLAPPLLVTRGHCHVPFNPQLERDLFPTVADIESAIRKVIN